MTDTSPKSFSDPTQFVAAMRGDLSLFARTCLKVRQKDASTAPLVLNRAQLVLHEALEAQRARTGFVRAIILKGRQQGISTYTAARFYHRAAMNKGVNVYILAHEQSASDNLFGIVDRFQRNNPIAPRVGASNAKELEFSLLDSSYVVATAGAKAGGRGRATSLFHASEAAFWPNAAEHFAASVQGVPLMPGTEVLIESTSAGAGGEYYERYQDAMAGRGDYIPVFLPWWLSDEYRRPTGPEFHLSDEAMEGELSEVEYAAMFGLDNGQMAWRRSKIHELRDPLLFRREYPATVNEAWTAPPGHEPFIAPLDVLRARKRTGVSPSGPLVIGVDPAANGGDRFSVAARRGNVVLWVRHRDKVGHLEAVAWLRSIIEEERPDRMCIDAGSIGSAIVSSLRSVSPAVALVVRGVNFGGTSESKLANPKRPGPRNRRAEMWDRLREWLSGEVAVKLPDNDELQADLSAPKRKPMLDNDFLLESKEDMRKRGIRSPDLGDAVALTFAFREFFKGWNEAAPGQPAQHRALDDPGYSGNMIDYAPNYGLYGWMG